MGICECSAVIVGHRAMPPEPFRILTSATSPVVQSLSQLSARNLIASSELGDISSEMKACWDLVGITSLCVICQGRLHVPFSP